MGRNRDSLIFMTFMNLGHSGSLLNIFDQCKAWGNIYSIIFFSHSTYLFLLDTCITSRVKRSFEPVWVKPFGWWMNCCQFHSYTEVWKADQLIIHLFLMNFNSCEKIPACLQCRVSHTVHNRSILFRSLWGFMNMSSYEWDVSPLSVHGRTRGSHYGCCNVDWG